MIDWTAATTIIALEEDNARLQGEVVEQLAYVVRLQAEADALRAQRDRALLACAALLAALVWVAVG